MTSHWKAILGVLLIFVLGFTSGLVCSSIYAHRKLETFLQQPAVVAEAALEKRLTRKLDLDDKQQQQVHAFFEKNLEQRRALNQQVQPQVRMVNLQTFQEINAVLRPEQQERFRQNIEQFRNRFGKAANNAEASNLPALGNPASSTPPPR